MKSCRKRLVLGDDMSTWCWRDDGYERAYPRMEIASVDLRRCVAKATLVRVVAHSVCGHRIEIFWSKFRGCCG